jgi:hypothetical protein
MGFMVALFVLGLSVAGSGPPELLPSRALDLPYVVVHNVQPVSFDLMDYRSEERGIAKHRPEVQSHTIFGIKRHLGFAGGYDYGTLHGAIGLYVTVAEWGRWNFGVPSPELGFGRYPAYDAQRNKSFMREEPSLFISLASVHYRVRYLRSLGVNWYVNLEQIFDMRQNVGGSQIGFSFSSR